MDASLKILSVAVGGALGAVARYLINISSASNAFAKFPFHTFIINISGSFLIGFLMILLTEKLQVNENLRLAIIVGFLGAFTTFSAFEIEIFDLIKDRQMIVAVLYLFLSVVVGFIGVAAGVVLARKF